jgi:hypothetical protein
MTATPFDTLTISLGGSQDDKTARLARTPGVLRHVYDGDHSHVGQVRKRRGFVRVPLNEELFGATPEALFLSLATHESSLVLVGYRDLYAVAAADDIVDGRALVRRGPSMVGTYRTGIIHSSTIGRES